MSANLRGILAVLVASTAFVLNDALIKLVSAELPTSEILILRGILATLLLIAGVLVLGAARPIAILFTPMMLLRVGSAATATVFIVLSLRHLPLATVTVVLQVTPLAVIAGSSILYGEKVSWRRWAAALTGFLGVVLIVRPGGGSFGAAVYVLLTALLFTTTRDLTTRGLQPRHPLDIRGRGQLGRYRAGRPGPRPLRRRLGDTVDLDLGRDDDLGGLSVRRQHLHDHGLAHRRDRRRRPVPLCTGAAGGAARLPVVGGPARYPRLRWHGPGAGCRPLYTAS